MSGPDSFTFQFESPDFDISSVLGPRTRHAIDTASAGNTFIIRERSRGNLSTATILATGKPLSHDDIDLIREAANEPCAFYNGRPIFRRLPPKQNFAIQLHGAAETLDLMIDLHDSSWGFYCGSESYQQWNWVGHHFVDIAKAAFPDIASKQQNAVWQKGQIARLEALHDDS